MANSKSHPLLHKEILAPAIFVALWVAVVLFFVGESRTLYCLVGVALGFMGSFVGMFTGEPTDDKKTLWFGFTYVFMLGSLAAAALPFFFLTPTGSAASLRLRTRDFSVVQRRTGRPLVVSGSPLRPGTGRISLVSPIASRDSKFRISTLVQSGV